MTMKSRPPWKVPGHPSGQGRENVSHFLSDVMWSYRRNKRWADGKFQMIHPFVFWVIVSWLLMESVLSSLAELLLGNADEYRFLTGGSIPVPGQSDSENFTQTMDSMAIMGFTAEESICKWFLLLLSEKSLLVCVCFGFAQMFLLLLSHAEGDLRRAPIWKHILQ